jgi:cysteine desulfurase
MEIYLDANATTPVLAQARAAALAAMADDFGNPSSVHGTGLKARASMESVRTRARRLLGAPADSTLLFTSGATEGIQTAVLSALQSLRGRPGIDSLLYGATEHKAVPEALRHWNRLLGLDLQVRAIPVGRDGRHDLAFLRDNAARAGLVCTMAANNETGVVSDLHGIAEAVAGSPALWLVDCVQALGKLPLRLSDLPIDYAPFSGHKLYAPKGIGLLYVRHGAPFTPLLVGGGQEQALRSGTENMSGIAALGAVLEALEQGPVFKDGATLGAYRERLGAALQDAFAGLVFNAPPALCLPTTLNFSVPGLSSRLLLDLFEAADMRVSGGSACSAAKAQPSDVLQAMGLPEWQTTSAVRLSFGPAATEGFIDEACERVRACGESLRESGLGGVPPSHVRPPDRLTRFVVDGACCYVAADPGSRRCVVIDPQPELTERLMQWLGCHGGALAGVLSTRSHGGLAASADALRAAVPPAQSEWEPVDAFGWPVGASSIALGAVRLERLPVPGQAADCSAYALHDADGLQSAFVGDTLPAGLAGAGLAQVLGPDALLLPGHDHDGRFATTLHLESAPRDAPVTSAELAPEALAGLMRSQPGLLLVDVREPYEQALGGVPAWGEPARLRAVPLPALLTALPDWLALPDETPVVFFCRSGNRSGQAARALRRLGHAESWSVAGGLVLWAESARAPESHRQRAV